MRYYLENDELKIELCDEGGEMFSIMGKKDNTEYLWNGRNYGWPLSAPTLFPIVCKVKDNKYTYNGKEYFMYCHGFANFAEYEVIHKENDNITFELKYREEYKELYPFKFSLKTNYKLKDNKIIISFYVENLSDTEEMIFSIGSHPSFKCPIKYEEELSDYYLEFEKVEKEAKVFEINEKDYLTGNENVYLKNNNIIKLTENTFKNGTILFNNLESENITLKSNNSSKYVKVNFSGFPYLALWATENTRPFVCIEPWYGHADFEDFTGDFSDKEDTLKLNPKEEFRCKYTIEIGQ